MEKLKNIWENYKLHIIGILIFLVIVVVVVICVNNNNEKKYPIVESSEYEIYLFGDTTIELYQNQKYQEPGYYALVDGKINRSDIEVIGTVDTSEVGSYIITYKIGNISKTRTVNVLEDPNTNGEIYLYLLGFKEISIYVGEEFSDPGAVAYNNKREDISENIVVEDNIDFDTPGVYYIKYILKYNDSIKELERKVIVEDSYKNDLELNLNYDNQELTNENVIINIFVTGSDYSYIKLPNGTTSKESNLFYEVEENGNYKFYAFDTRGNYKVESVEINNIDKEKPTGVCTAKVYNSKTVIEVNAYDDNAISKYSYNEYTSTNSNYVINQKLDSVKVVIYDTAGNSDIIDCQIENSYLEMHFILSGHDDDAILIRTDDKTIMIDGGRYSCRTRVTPYLKKLGVTTIDAMIGSHVQYNHIQAQADILDNFTVKKVYYSVDINTCVSKKYCVSSDVKYIKNKLNDKNITPTVLGPKDVLTIGDMKLYFLGPIKITSNQNNNSFIFILEYGNNKFMFTGDSGGSGMNVSTLTSYAKEMNITLDVDMLKYPHHGNQNLTTDFLNALTPKYVIIPNYGHSSHPTSSNRKKLKNVGAEVYELKKHGNIVLISDGETIEVKTNQKAIDYKK